MSEMITETEARLMSHEAVCAQRYEQINRSLESGARRMDNIDVQIKDSSAASTKRMDKIEYLVYAVLAAVLLGPGAAAEFFRKIVGL